MEHRNDDAELDKPSAQRRADAIRVFREELTRVEREGALELSDPQRTRLAAHHDRLLADLQRRFDIDVSEGLKQMSWGMRIASTLGALALSVAVFLFFYRIWGSLATAVQLLLLVAAPVLAVVATHACSRRERTPYFTSLFGMLALACFMLDLSVVGSIFNIAESPRAFLAWGLFGVALAYAYGLRLLLAAGLVCLLEYVAATLGAWSGIYWVEVMQQPEHYLLVGALIFVMPLLLPAATPRAFAPVYRLVGALAVLFPSLVLAHWGDGSRLPLSAAVSELFYQVAGFALAAAAMWLGIRRGWRETVHTGLAFFVVMLYTDLFDWWWELMPRYLFFLVLGLVAVGLLVVLHQVRRRVREVTP